MHTLPIPVHQYIPIRHRDLEIGSIAVTLNSFRAFKLLFQYMSDRRIAMPFKCQEDSYLKAFSSVVRAVTPAECKIAQLDGKLVKEKGFEVVLDDTVLFPEGGGQPDDRGTISGVDVLRVTRRGADAVHFVQSQFDVGEKVDLKVDWARRFDHMQQHTGQHLITAIADQKYGYKTTSWDLGSQVSFIELDTPAMTADQMKEVENACNEAIRKHTNVIVHVTEVGSDLLEGVRARGLPSDHVGSVRIVEIEGIDSNMCCGTHVRNLSDLICVKLLATEKGKKGKTNLHFIVGDRVLNSISRMYATEKSLTKNLKCGPKEHVEAVERNIKQLKQAQKVSTKLLREIAAMEANAFKSQENKYIRLHRREGNNEYMNIFANELNRVECTVFLTVGDEKGEGLFLLAGSESFLEQCSGGVCEAISGKGAVKNGRMQGKAVNLKNIRLAEEIIEKFLAKSS